MNTILSFGYSLLAECAAERFGSSGLNPPVGFFHKSSGRIFSLALDLMEEFRSVMVISLF